jgi:hypothetical protein
VERCLTVLRNNGIRRCHVFVLRSNDDGRRFWKRIGWKDQEDIGLITRDTPAG